MERRGVNGIRKAALERAEFPLDAEESILF